jgi:vancomycin resistance protein YoaR
LLPIMATLVTDRTLASPQAVRRPLWPLLLLWVLTPFLALTVALTWFEWTYRDRVYPGVQALGIPLGGMTPAEVRSVLQQAAAHYAPPALFLRHEEQIWALPVNTWGAQVDVETLTRQAYLVGRTGTLLQNLLAQVQAFQQGWHLDPAFRVQPGQIEATLATLTAGLNRPAVEARLSLDALQVVAIPAQPGRQVDLAATTQAVLARLALGQPGVVDVVVREVMPATADLREGEATIRRFLNRTIVLTDPGGEFQFALDPGALARLVDWTPDPNAVGGLRAVIRRDALEALVAEWAAQVARPPLDARLDFDPQTGRLIVLSPAVVGYALDTEATVATILQALEKGETQVILPVQVLPPTIPSDNLERLGIKELVAEGTTSFAGSSPDRVKNIEVAAAKFVGVVIPPGGIFSFNEHVGDVTAANGFEDALVIAGDTTAVGIGGGVCQVSTTVFRAAWFGGFPILERWNHGYVVRWYGAPGLDATIYTPTVDFKFRNSTGHYLLIKPIVDTKRGILTFRFYGTNPGWRVETSEPVYSNRQPPPPPLYIEDPDLPPGRVVQFDWAVEGLEAVARRRVLAADGTVLSNDVLRSRYQPWQAKYRFGPGFEPPPGAIVRRR